MSLRTDIHVAFDAVSPATGGMAERVVETARRAAHNHRGMNAMGLRIRVPLALVAAFVLIALVVAVFVGTRLFHSSLPTAAPAGQQTQYEVLVGELESRPVNLPVSHSEADCPNSPNNTLGYDFGAGPVYANGAPAMATSWGDYWDIAYYVDSKINGPVLIRGRDLITGESVIFSGKHAYGPGASTPGVSAGWHTEALLNTDQPDLAGSSPGRFIVRQSLSKAFIGCVGFQIDGATFSETMTAWSPG